MDPNKLPGWRSSSTGGFLRAKGVRGALDLRTLVLFFGFLLFFLLFYLSSFGNREVENVTDDYLVRVLVCLNPWWWLSGGVWT
jgi:preprotein translocase subunit SecG